VLAGLELYGQEYVKLRFDAAFLDLSATIEYKGKALADQISLPRSVYVEKHAPNALLFLLEVQKWKMLYVDDQYDVFAVSRASDIAAAIYDFFHAPTPADRLTHLLRITSKGSACYQDSWQKGLKRALAVARFLDPQHWAFVDWRILGVMGYRSMTALKQERIGSNADQIRQLFEPIQYFDLEIALEMLQEYRCEDLPRAVDVECALYAISLDIWRPGQTKENLRRIHH